MKALKLLFILFLALLFCSCNRNYDRCQKTCDDMQALMSRSVTIDSIHPVNLHGQNKLRVILNTGQDEFFDNSIEIFPGKSMNQIPIFEPEFDKERNQYVARFRYYDYKY